MDTISYIPNCTKKNTTQKTPKSYSPKYKESANYGKADLQYSFLFRISQAKLPSLLLGAFFGGLLCPSFNEPDCGAFSAYDT